RVLLVDADLRRPSLDRYLDVPPDVPGLSSVLSGESLLADTVRPVEGHLAFLPSGPLPGDPAALFAGAAVGDLLAQLAGRYDV
ncbi:tyrosine protein kinase, partial [Klebsiella pneumoniae]